ncbi:MAG TPA: STAS domain-containing protein [Streptosporangiaceae bacterium]|nr:STAS domain-containing protein [Streptosporangiaceae bacterium]
MEEGRSAATTAAPSVVTLPREIDATNSDLVHSDLIAMCVCGVTMVIADLSSTKFCDSSAVRALVRAHQFAAGAGIELRFVVSSPSVLRVLELSGLRNVLRLYPSVDAAAGS